MRRIRRSVLCVVLGAALLAPALTAVSRRARVIILGNEELTDVLFIDSARFALNDAKLMQDLFSSGKLAFDYGPGAIHSRTEVTYPAAKVALREAITGALPGETLYIIISGRGIAYPVWDQGFVFFKDSRFEKPQSTALSIRQLKEWIEVSPAAEVWVFADLSRQSEKIRDNRINFRIESELKTISSPPFGAILSARARQVSHLGDKHGIFTYYLANGLYGASPQDANADSDKDGRVTIAELQRYIDGLRSRANVPLAPNILRGARAGGQTAVVVLGQTKTPTARNWQHQPPVLLASRLPGLLSLPMQAAAAAPPVEAPPCPPLDDAAHSDPVSAARSLLAQRAATDTAVWNRRAGCLALAFEEIGQDVVSRYGIGDLFPSDPLKLQPQDFANAAQAFQAALLLQPGQINLILRERLCDGRAKAASAATLAEARKILEDAIQLQNQSGETLPELDNALGYTYLESGDYRAAIPYLENAKRLSPTWAYPRHNLALASLELGDWARAESEYRQAIQLTPNYPYLHYNLGLLLHRTNRERQAQRSYEEALRQCDRAIDAWDAAASRWLSEDAEFARTRAGVYRQHKAEIANALGALFASRGSINQARRRYEEALAADARNTPAAYNLAQLLLQNRIEGEKAIALLRDIRTHDPSFDPSRRLLDSPDLYLNAGDIDRQRGQQEAACRSYRLAMQVSEANAGNSKRDEIADRLRSCR